MLAAWLIALGGEPQLPAFFSDHMVLQRATTVPLWGTAAPGERIAVAPDWRSAPLEITADENGRWRVYFDTPRSGGPFVIRVTGAGGTRVLSDVLVGEVWLASGQSNMEWTLGPGVGNGVEGWEEAVRTSKDPSLRFFGVENAVARQPQADVGGRWLEADPESSRAFSATAYFFARALRRELGVPVGVIAADWGGTPAEAWVSLEGLEDFPEFFEELGGLEDQAKAVGPHTPSALWNGMVAPLVPFALRGAIWYQGESNRERAEQYLRLFPALIQAWRVAFGRFDFPFYFVQIAPFAYEGDTGQAAALRDAQRLTLAKSNTGMAVTMDIGDPADIHPLKKREVGERLALWALAKTYGREVVCSGPLYRAMAVAESSIRIEFEHARGLTSRDEPVRHATIAGADRVFHPAGARIEGEALVVSSPLVPSPVAVRFGWGAADMTNLWNAAGLPASSFRTDDWPEAAR